VAVAAVITVLAASAGWALAATASAATPRPALYIRTGSVARAGRLAASPQPARGGGVVFRTVDDPGGVST
jgi:hypothetical protein